MKKDFTPGEWKQSHREIPNNKKGMYATQVYTEDGETIATLGWYPKPQEKGLHEGKPILITGTYRDANAKLIASAPDLLNACMTGFALCDKLQFPTEEELRDMRDIFKKVLEKALT